MGLLDFVKNNISGSDGASTDPSSYDPNAGMSSSTMPVNPADPNSFATTVGGNPAVQMGGAQPVQQNPMGNTQYQAPIQNQFSAGAPVSNPQNDIQNSQMQQMQDGLFNPGVDATQFNGGQQQPVQNYQEPATNQYVEPAQGVSPEQQIYNSGNMPGQVQNQDQFNQASVAPVDQNAQIAPYQSPVEAPAINQPVQAPEEFIQPPTDTSINNWQRPAESVAPQATPGETNQYVDASITEMQNQFEEPETLSIPSTGSAPTDQSVSSPASVQSDVTEPTTVSEIENNNNENEIPLGDPLQDADAPAEKGVQDVVNVADTTENIEEVKNEEKKVPDLKLPDIGDLNLSNLNFKKNDGSVKQASLTDEMMNKEANVAESTVEEPEAEQPKTSAVENPKTEENKENVSPNIAFESLPKKDLLFKKIAIVGISSLENKDTAIEIVKRFGSMGITMNFDSLKSISGGLIESAGVNAKQVHVPFIDGDDGSGNSMDDLGEITTIVYSNLFDYYRHLIKESRAFVVTSLDSLDSMNLVLLLLKIQRLYGNNAKPLILMGDAVTSFDTVAEILNEDSSLVHKVSSPDELMKLLGELNTKAGSDNSLSLPRKVDRRVPGDERDFLLY